MHTSQNNRLIFWTFLLVTSLFLVAGCSIQTSKVPGEDKNIVIEPGLEDSDHLLDPAGSTDSTELADSGDSLGSGEQEVEGGNELDQDQGENNVIVGGGYKTNSIPILYYHSIDYEEGNELRVPAEEFDAHMELLHKEGYKSITPDELYAYFYKGGTLPDKPILITFDDGYEDNYTNGFPIAQKYGFVGTIFMVTDWIDGRNYLKREQIKEMSQAGWVIASHTRSHPYLTGMNQEQRKVELEGSRKVLEEILGHPIKYFAYPYGVYDQDIINDSKATGYTMAFTTERGWGNGEDPFRLQRIYCYANMGLEELKRRIEDPNY